MKRAVVAVWGVVLLAVFLTGCNPATEAGKVQSAPGGEATPVAEVAAVPQPATEPFPGYTLFTPLRSTNTYLVNLDGKVVHMWQAESSPGSMVYLLENGDLLRGARIPEHDHFRGGGIGGRIQRFDWDGSLIWDFVYANDDHCLHHDIEPLPNGNILMVAWERKTKEDAIAAGRDPELVRDELWPDHVIEVQPEGSTGGKIVWEWHLWDHLIQDLDETKQNYGVVAENPGLVDVNLVGATPPPSP
jgi:hypothetical protein